MAIMLLSKCKRGETLLRRVVEGLRWNGIVVAGSTGSSAGSSSVEGVALVHWMGLFSEEGVDGVLLLGKVR